MFFISYPLSLTCLPNRNKPNCLFSVCVEDNQNSPFSSNTRSYNPLFTLGITILMSESKWIE